MSEQGVGKRVISFRRLMVKSRSPVAAKTVNEVAYQEYTIRELETGTIEIWRQGGSISPVKPVLRELALALNVGLLNNNGNPHNTRQLGTQVIKSIQEFKALGASSED